MTDLYRLVYTSRSHVGGDEDGGERAVARVLASSRRDNGRAGVTGALLLGAGSFAQVLEGPRADVEATFARIGRDPRHGDISVLQRGPVAERVFPGRPMAFVDRSAREHPSWEGLARSLGFGRGRVDGDDLCATLLALLRAEEAVPRGLDVERLRSALDAERPDIRAERSPEPAAASDGAPARFPSPPASATPSAAPAAAPDAEESVLRAALDQERERTTALRRELDEARIAAARAMGEAEGLGRHRDIWADRSSQLRGSLKDAREALLSAEAERDALRTRVAAHAGERDTLRIHRDIWAERARALAKALTRDPVVDRDGAAPAGADRPAPDRRWPSLVDVAS